MRWTGVWLAAAVSCAPIAALAAEGPAPACAARDAALPGPMASWASKATLSSADKAGDLPKAMLTVGQAVSADLHPTRGVAYVAQPEKPGGSVAHGGLFEVRIDQAGTYRIGLDSGAWIDVLKDKTALVSTAHGPGPSCSTIRKVVTFDLQPGVYVIQISANADPKIALIVSRAS